MPAFTPELKPPEPFVDKPSELFSGCTWVVDGDGEVAKVCIDAEPDVVGMNDDFEDGEEEGNEDKAAKATGCASKFSGEGASKV